MPHQHIKVILETSLSRQSLSPVSTTYKNKQETEHETCEMTQHNQSDFSGQQQHIIKKLG